MKRSLGVWLLVIYAAFLALAHLVTLATLVPGVLPDELLAAARALPTSAIVYVVVDMLLFGSAAVATWRLKRVAASLFVAGLALHLVMFTYNAIAMPDFFASQSAALFLPQAISTAIGVAAIVGSRRLVKRGVLV